MTVLPGRRDLLHGAGEGVTVAGPEALHVHGEGPHLGIVLEEVRDNPTPSGRSGCPGRPRSGARSRGILLIREIMKAPLWLMKAMSDVGPRGRGSLCSGMKVVSYFPGLE